MTIEELDEIEIKLKEAREMIYIPKSFFNLGLKGRTFVVYDYLSRINYFSVKSKTQPFLDYKTIATSLKMEEEAIVDSLNELITNSIIKVKPLKDSKYEFNINFDYIFSLIE